MITIPTSSIDYCIRRKPETEVFHQLFYQRSTNSEKRYTVCTKYTYDEHFLNPQLSNYIIRLALRTDK